MLVYIGAISILIIFAIMMTRRLMQTTETPFNSQPIAGLVGALAWLCHPGRRHLAALAADARPERCWAPAAG